MSESDRATAPAPAPVGGGAAGATAGGLPFWLIRLAALGWRALVIVAFVLVVLAIAAAVPTVTAAILVAGLASSAVAPLVSDLRKRGWGSGRASAVATLLVAGVAVLILGVVAYILVAYGPDLLRNMRAGADALRSGELGQFLSPAIAEAVADLLDSAVRWLASNVGTLIGNAANILTILLFAGFTTFYVLQDFDRGWRWATQGMDERHREAAAASAWLAVQRIGGYLRRTTVIALMEAIIVLALLVLFGVAVPVPLAGLVFAGGFIPYIGAIGATIAILLVALGSVGPAWSLVLLVLIVVLNVVTDRLVGPRLERVSARVNPAVVLIALPIGASLGGLFGLVVAVPTAAALLAVGTSVVDIVRPDDPGSEPAAWSVVPPWLDILAQWSWRLLVGIALVATGLLAVLQVPALITPLVIAAVLAATYAIPVAFLVRRGWARGVATTIVTLGITGTIAVLTVLSVVSLAGGIRDLAASIREGSGAVNDFLEGLAGALDQLVDMIAGAMVEIVVGLTLGAAAVVIVVIVGIVLTYYLLRDGRAVWSRLTSGAAPWRRDALDSAASSAASVLGGYMIGTGTVSLFGAATQFLIMVVLGVPFALPVFVLSFFGGYIPYVGTLLTTGIAFLITLTTGDTVAIVVMAIFTVVFNIVQGNVVQPLVIGRAVNIHPAIVLLAIPAGGALAGVLGMFLVVPFIGVVAATWRTVLVVLGRPPALGAAGEGETAPPERDATTGELAEGLGPV